MPFIKNICAKNYNLTTIANDHGSRHPFIMDDEVDKLVENWNKQRPFPAEDEQ